MFYQYIDRIGGLAFGVKAAFCVPTTWATSVLVLDALILDVGTLVGKCSFMMNVKTRTTTKVIMVLVILHFIIARPISD